MTFKLTKEEQKILLKLAREAIESWIKGKEKPKLPKITGNLGAKSGAFVTIHKRGELRGCIGRMVGEAPLAETVQKMAIAAATEDTRFPMVDETELSEIDLEISVLSPMKRITDVSEIEVGRHGILLGKGWNRGVLLPQVAVEYGWDRKTFLEHTCLKAGLPSDAWKDAETIIEIFSAEVFGERSIE